MEVNFESLKSTYSGTLCSVGVSFSIETGNLDVLATARALEHETFPKTPVTPALIIVSGLSGAGKTTTLRHIDALGYKKIRTVTTRPKRAAEKDDEAFFLDNQTFNNWVEQERVFYPHTRNGVQQGIYLDDIRSVEQPHAHLYTDRSVASAQKLLKEFSTQNIFTLYILPPTLDDLYARLTLRESSNLQTKAHTLSKEDILTRLNEEIMDMNLLMQTKYSFIVNDEQNRLKSLIEKTFTF